ncbi:MAG TPA: hypothetical protein VHB79_39350 [Polyangiaceae bacterium]|nr:hypothetical protein [Polyangiaceae bacterium]
MRFAAAWVSVTLLVACAGRAPLAPVPELPRVSTAIPGVTGATAPAPPAVSASAAPVPVPAAPSTSTAPPSLPAVSLGDIGTSAELRVVATSASGGWVALCNAGSTTPTLVLGSGTGEPIEDLLARDATGRYVVVAKEGAALLIDTAQGTRVNLSELGADVRRARADYAEHRTLSFDAAARSFAYLRQQGSARSIVVRELESGAEQSFAVGAGDVYRLELSADGRYVSFDALREDSNKNGKLDWPAPEDTARPSPCAKPGLPKFRSFGYQGRGDALTRAVLTLADGSLRDVPELVTPLGRSLLVRESDGALKLDQHGKRTPLAPASCAGRVLFADAERELVLTACTPPPPPLKKGKPPPPPTGKRQVWLFGAGFAKDLQSELYETSTDRAAVVGTRLVPLYPGSEAGLVDLERRELLPLAGGSRVITTRAALALVWRESDLYRYDAQTKTEQHLAHGVLKNPDLLQAGATVLLSPFVIVDVEAPALASPRHALALSAGGFVLTAGSEPEATATGVAPAIRGPLHWVDARAVPAR